MVSTHLLPAVVALVALQQQQTAASSLYYDPVTSSGTTDEISSKFPARGGQVEDADCAITVEVDPTLPDITTISTVVVTYLDLLANMTSAPTEAVSTKVGKTIIQECTPSKEADQDAYTTTTQTSTTSSSSGTTTSTQSKTGTTVSPASTSTFTSTTTKTGTVLVATESAKVTDAPNTMPSKTGGVSKDDPNCATGWEKLSRKLRHSPMTGRKLEEKMVMRQLESNKNTDVAKLEAYFGSSMETTLSKLPTVAVHTPSPWPGPYWPTYQDSINVIWSSGEPSAAEKYAKAFGLDVTDFMNKVSKDNGVDSMSTRTKCSTESDCAGRTDGSSCAIRADATSGYCIPKWFGICHAWAPAAMMEPEPNCPVTHNGVTFQPMDLKALISDVYDGAGVSTVFTGTRFNGGTDTIDQYGRHSSVSYRDLNPAYFHIAATNLLGNLNATFVVDVTAGSEVWNQPVRGVKVYEQTAMSLEEAAQTFYGLEKYPWNAAAESIVYVKTRLSWIVETYTDGGLVSSGQVDKFTTGKYYTYLLEMDADGVIIGGEWVYGSDEDHPDFIWFPKAKPAANTVTSIGLSYADVSMLLGKSVACSDSSSGSESNSSSRSSTSASKSSSASVSASFSASSSASASGSSSASSSDSASSSASVTSSPSASSSASASDSAGSVSSTASSFPGSASTGSDTFTNSTGSQNFATVDPMTDAPTAPVETPTAPIETPVAPIETPVTPVETLVASPETPVVTESITSTPTIAPFWNPIINNQNDDNSDDNLPQDRHWWQSSFHTV